VVERRCGEVDTAVEAEEAVGIATDHAFECWACSKQTSDAAPTSQVHGGASYQHKKKEESKGGSPVSGHRTVRLRQMGGRWSESRGCFLVLLIALRSSSGWGESGSTTLPLRNLGGIVFYK
jgi:hypothetical protein